MVRKTTLVVMALAGTLASFGTACSETLAEQGWQPVPNISVDTNYHYKPKTLKPTGENIIGAWIRREQSEDRMGLNPVMVTFDEYDCKNLKVRRTVGKVFQKGFEPQDYQPEPWTDVQKGSKDEGLMQFVCLESKKP